MVVVVVVVVVDATAVLSFCLCKNGLNSMNCLLERRVLAAYFLRRLVLFEN